MRFLVEFFTVLSVVLGTIGANPSPQQWLTQLLNTIQEPQQTYAQQSNAKMLSMNSNNFNNRDLSNMNNMNNMRSMNNMNMMQRNLVQDVSQALPALFQQSSSLVSLSACSPNPCQNEGVCTVGNQGDFSCKCPWGWTGARCDICLTECASNPCPLNKICRAKFGGGFDCVCPADRAGQNCEIQNDLCANNPCLNGGSCTPSIGGSFTCSCNQPWSGKNCEQVWQNPCTEESLRNTEIIQHRDPWDRHSYLICVDVNKYHSMPCSVGTYFNENLAHCVPEGYDPPNCPNQYCKNDGECLVDENNLLKCVCKKGFSGDQCEVNIDECLIEGNSACMGGQCVDQVNGYYCRCPNGIGLNCRETIQNPCSASNINIDKNFHELPTRHNNIYIHCTGENLFTLNKCPENLFWHPEEQTCTIERPPLRSGVCQTLPCKNGGICQEGGVNGFTCACKTGYTGVTCEQMIDYCLSSPCHHNGRCLSYAGGYTCVCENKVIDECCCHGVENPCPQKSRLVPGVNNYFNHLFPHRYIHCDFDGRAFVRTCAPGTRWNQNVLSCLPDNFVLNQTEPVPSSYGVQAYGYNQNRPVAYGQTAPVAQAPVVQQQYQQAPVQQQYQQAPVQVTPAPYSAPVEVTQAPVVVQQQYQPAPVQQQYQQAPVQQQYQPAPVQQQQYQPAPVQVTPAPYSAPVEVTQAPVVQQQYQQAPVQVTPAPYSAPVEVTQAPVVQQQYQPAPVQQQQQYQPAPVQQQYQPAPVQQQYQQAPVQVTPAPYSAPVEVTQAPVVQQQYQPAPVQQQYQPAPVQQQYQPAPVQQQFRPAPVQVTPAPYTAPVEVTQAPVVQQQYQPAPVQQQQYQSAPVQQQQQYQSAPVQQQQYQSAPVQQQQQYQSASVDLPIQRNVQPVTPVTPAIPQLQLTQQQILQLIQAGVKLPDSLMRSSGESVQKLSSRRLYGMF